MKIDDHKKKEREPGAAHLTELQGLLEGAPKMGMNKVKEFEPTLDTCHSNIENMSERCEESWRGRRTSKDA